MIGVSAEQAAANWILFAAALRGDTRSRHSNGQLASQRGGFGTSANRFGMVRKAPASQISKAGKQKARAQARNRKAHRKGNRKQVRA